MPEGLEVFILSKAMKSLGFECSSYGKHLLIKELHNGEKYDISFGLIGKIKLDKNLKIQKIENNEIPSGDMKKINSYEEAKEKLGIDWVKATKEEISEIVYKWKNRKKQIGALLIEQNELCGIGVAWASEILHNAKINPTEKAHTLEFLNLIEPLINSIIYIRDKMIKNYLQNIGVDNIKFVNEWFENLYKIREKDMKVYKKGDEIKVGGRIFYIYNNKWKK
jgi:formamidopyrimidine-DNA glycosylase